VESIDDPLSKTAMTCWRLTLDDFDAVEETTSLDFGKKVQIGFLETMGGSEEKTVKELEDPRCRREEASIIPKDEVESTYRLKIEVIGNKRLDIVRKKDITINVIFEGTQIQLTKFSLFFFYVR